MKVLIIGSGWTGASAANLLNENGVKVKILEKESVTGGHSRSAEINGVFWEPFGAHIFHTNNDSVASFVNKHGLTRKYEHKVLTSVKIDGEEKLLNWPPQINQLKENLPNWKQIEKELNNLPNTPDSKNFQEYVISMMGPSLFELFIEGYSIKQWGENLEELSSSFAPKRIEIRNDNYTRLFKDKYEYFNPKGITPIINSILREIDIEFENEVSIENIEKHITDYDHVILTCPLDEFLNKKELGWRGVKLDPKYFEVSSDSECITNNYVINYPDLDIPYTRTVETKHATGQLIKGTVVAKEYPGTDDQHYPIPTVDNRYENINLKLKEEIESLLNIKVHFAGRLANYTYINQDQAILEGWAVASKILG